MAPPRHYKPQKAFIKTFYWIWTWYMLILGYPYERGVVARVPPKGVRTIHTYSRGVLLYIHTTNEKRILRFAICDLRPYNVIGCWRWSILTNA